MGTLIAVGKIMVLWVAVKVITSYLWALTELHMYEEVKSYKLRHWVTGTIAVGVCLLLLRYV